MIRVLSRFVHYLALCNRAPCLVPDLVYPYPLLSLLFSSSFEFLFLSLLCFLPNSFPYYIGTLIVNFCHPPLYFKLNGTPLPKYCILRDVFQYFAMCRFSFCLLFVCHVLSRFYVLFICLGSFIFYDTPSLCPVYLFLCTSLLSFLFLSSCLTAWLSVSRC